ncbi:MAG TPA: isoprenylcysteine carboxylmethyltransferase family protein [Candidatus Acidoferrales bacterium]|jgi:protein-S-isoprenylcysteine O-methyltransferase Ste14|nr:isoprenylcysteine carboxylmethyltransferase family protein [Candidatus Acidoferrales bacterium]
MQLHPLPFSAGPIFAFAFWGAYAAWILPEVVAWRVKRSGDFSKVRDQGSLNLIAILWWTGIALDFGLALLLPQASISWRRTSLFFVGICFMLLGVALRWYSAAVLGKYFTFDVAIQSDQVLIEAGPYRYIRHPSYSGALLSLLGCGLALGNWVGLCAALCCLGVAYGYRIPVEEAVLASALGNVYKQYVKRTWRLVPFLF